jgi:hypothetical protein
LIWFAVIWFAVMVSSCSAALEEMTIVNYAQEISPYDEVAVLQEHIERLSSDSELSAVSTMMPGVTIQIAGEIVVSDVTLVEIYLATGNRRLRIARLSNGLAWYLVDPVCGLQSDVWRSDQTEIDVPFGFADVDNRQQVNLTLPVESANQIERALNATCQ